MERRQGTRRVTLPSGREVEVAFQDDPATLQQRAMLPETSGRTLNVCERCDSGLVYPTHWDEAGADNWRAFLRCPNCEWHAEGIFEQQVMEDFDEQLDCGTEKMVADLRKLMQANMSEEIDRFAAALSAGAILPEDF